METYLSKVVIVGGGVSGLFAAKTLSDSGLFKPNEITICEAQDYLGGRIRTKVVNNVPLEMGAQWIHGRGDNPLWKFALENNIPISDTTNPDGEGIFLSQSGDEPPENILQSTLTFLENLHDSVYDVLDKNGDLKSGIPSSVGEYFKFCFDEWLNQFIGIETEDNIRWRKRIYDWRILWENCDLGCSDLNENSIYTFAKYEEFEGGDACFANGYDSFVDSVVRQIQDKVKIFLNKEVTKVKKDDAEELMYIECADETRIEANTVIVTVSLGVLKSNMHIFDHESILWPSSVLRAIHHIAFGSISYIKMEFDQCFWDESNPGIMILRDSDVMSPYDYEDGDHWINYVYGFDSVLGHPNVLMGWLSGQESRAMQLCSDEEIGNQLTQLLRKVMSKRDLKTPIKLKNIHVTRWNQNKFVQGTYSYATRECVKRGIHHRDLRTPITYSNSKCIALILAGEATSDDCAGTVHGALISGVEQAKEILKNNNFKRN